MSLRASSSRFWKSLFASAASRRPGRRRTHLAFDVLEDRSLPSTLLVTTTADGGAGSLRAAVTQANTDAAAGISDTINFAPSLNGESIVLGSFLEISGASTAGSTIAIDGGGQIALDGGGSARILQVDSGADALVTGLTIVNGVAGGAAIDNQGTLLLQASTIANNAGAGIANGGTLTLSTSTIASNYGQGIDNSGTMTISACTVSNNSSNVSEGKSGGAVDGGGIDNSGTLTATNSTVYGNHATGSGGGIYNSGSLALSDCTVTANTAAQGGGGIDNANTTSGSLLLNSTIVAGNVNSTSTTSQVDLAGNAIGNFNLIGMLTGGTMNQDRGNKLGGSTSSGPIDPHLDTLNNLGGPTQTVRLLSGSPAIGAGGPMTTLTSAIGGPGSTFSVANAAAVTATAGDYVLSIDGEQVLAAYAGQNNFTVLQRGYGGTTQTLHMANDGVFLADDQAGRVRVQNGQTDMGALADIVLAVAANPQDQTVTAGQPATFTASAVGQQAITGVEWWVSEDNGSTFSQIPGNARTMPNGLASATLTVPITNPAKNGYLYEVVFSDPDGMVATSPARLTVLTLPQVTVNPITQSVAPGQSVTFTAASAESSDNVRWQVSSDGGRTFTAIPNATSASYTVSASYNQNGYEYEAVFSNADGSVTTNPATLLVTGAPTVLVNLVSQTVTGSSLVTFNVVAAATPAASVQWQVSSDGGKTFTAVHDLTTTTYSFIASGSENGDIYQAVFTNSDGTTPTAQATLTVNYLDTPAVSLPSSPVLAGQPVTLASTGAANPAPNMQWQMSTDGGNTFQDISNATGPTYTFTPTGLMDGYQYQVVYTNTVTSKTSAPVTLTVGHAPVFLSNPANQAVYSGETLTLTATVSGEPTPSYQWEIETPGSSKFVPDTTDLVTTSPGAVTGSEKVSLGLQVTSKNLGASYRLMATNAHGWQTSGAATINTDHVTQNPEGQRVDAGQQAVFQASAFNSGDTVQWFVVPPNAPASSGQPLSTNSVYSGVNSTTLIVNAATNLNGYHYYAEFFDIGTIPLVKLTLPTSAALLTVNPALTVGALSSTLNVGQPVPAVSINGGTPQYTVTAAGLPPGVTPYLYRSGHGYQIAFKGTTTTEGLFIATLTVEDAAGATVSVPFHILVNGPMPLTKRHQVRRRHS